MQSQGEVYELIIEDALKVAFPQDDVMEVKKGQKGADCILRKKITLADLLEKLLLNPSKRRTFQMIG